MKKLTLLSLLTGLAVCIQAQPELAAIAFQGGANTTGTIIQYIGGDTSVAHYYSLPSGSCSSCGYGPQGSLIMARDGKMYGMTTNDGAYGAGTIFQYDYPSNTYTVLANFDTLTSGGFPQGSLFQASNGLLYGLTSIGGANSCGTFFSYSIGADSIIKLEDMPAIFQRVRLNSVIQSSNGKLYGMTDYDGDNFGGTIFEYDINSATYTVVHSLPLYSNPYGDLLEVGTDTLYGLTLAGGATDDGMIFRYVPATDSFTVLYNFDAAHGESPESSLIRAIDGKLYGTTTMGGALANGVLFSFDPVTLTYRDVFDFTTNGGFSPQGGLCQARDGNLYGMTVAGGESGNGTIYQYNISQDSVTFEFSFNYTDGSGPVGHLIQFASAINITRQPSATGNCAGTTAVFSANATGDTSVQWQVSTNGGATFSNITGATDTVYSFTATAAENGYLYRAIFSNYSLSDTTAPAMLTVNAAINNINATICPGGGYSLGGHDYTLAGTYRDTVPGGSVFGCDSVVVLNLSVTAINDSAVAAGPVCTALQNGATYQWLDCAGKVALSNATSQSYIATLNGAYRCVVSYGGCIDTTNCITVNDAGVNSVDTYHFDLYPNPASSSFVIDNDYPGALSVKVLSMVGDKLKEYTLTGTRGTFDISELSQGIYEVQISDGEQVVKVMKVVKE